MIKAESSSSLVESSSTKEEEEDGDSSDLLMRYNTLLDTYPVHTKVLTSFFVQGFGAFLGSYLTRRSGKKRGKKKNVDWVEVFAFMIHGGLVNAPICHYWFEWLEKNGPESTFKSMLLDQLVVQPPLLLLMFLTIDMTKSALNEMRPSLSRNVSVVGPTIFNSWKFWPLAVYLTFTYLKKKHYTVALNLCSLAWTIYLSKES